MSGAAYAVTRTGWRKYKMLYQSHVGLKAGQHKNKHA